ncbi:MAG: cobalamin-dependent protein, partial [Actinomycetota bacterium]|nr:cobalamin-dependent protein [Actinomycetota bacterium]
FVELLERADQPGAVGLVTGLAEQGAAPEALVLEVLAPAQREVGRRWEDGRWSVAQEHAATAVTDTALGLLALDAEPNGNGRHAVVACVEGEWHSLPARMAAEVLRLRGWHVTFLGGSVPADDLARYAAAHRPDAVGLSCSMPVSLKGAARSIAACRRVGVPVLAGGSGFGPEGRYAARLGASTWAGDPVVAATLLESGLHGGSPSSVAPEDADGDEHRELEREKDDIVSVAVAQLENDDARVREALTFLVSTLESALFVDDHAVIAACRPATERLLAAGDPSTGAASAALDTLFGIVQERFPGAWGLVEESRLVEIKPAAWPDLNRT